MHETAHIVREANLEDIPRLTHIMIRSFRVAFADFVSQETMNSCTNEDNCYAMLRNIYQSGTMHFLIGDDAGMLVWQKIAEGQPADQSERVSVEIVALHSLPETIGSGLGHAILTYALEQIYQTFGKVPVFLWAFRDNTRARRFYEKHGFQWDGSERISEFDGAIEVCYVKKFAGK